MLNPIREHIVDLLIAMLGGLLTDSPEDAQGYIRLAKLKIRQGDFAGAITELDVTLKHDPLNANAYHLRSRAKYEVGQTESAAGDAIAALELQSGNGMFHYMHGNICLRLGKFLEAEGSYSEALRLGKTEAHVWAGRGYANYGLRHYSQSLHDLVVARDMGFDSDALEDYIESCKAQLDGSG